MTTTTAPGEIRRYADWMDLARHEYDLTLAVLRGLDESAWSAPTDCTGWDVRAMVAHLVGAAEATASIRESLRQLRAGKKVAAGRPDVDGINDVQIAERADRTPAQLVDDLADAAVRGVRGRSRLPAPIRAIRVPFGPPLGVKSLGYLNGRIYTRDCWMHRVDIWRATGAPLVLTADHDGRIVGDVVAEWAATHTSSYSLTLTGPAGGTYSAGDGGPHYELDAVEFARTVSGRARGTGLLTTEVPF